MNVNDQEIESKFYVRYLPTLEQKLINLGAVKISERVLESNLRFDTPAGDLTRERRALRLRQDAVARLTFKGPAQPGQSVSMRQEIEFEVSSFNSARAFLKALGYQVMAMYEKYRTTYTLNGLEVVLDELPYGNFIEIEGPDADSIRAVADALGLNWDARVMDSYLSLFERLRAAGLKANTLSFEELRGQAIDMRAIGVGYSD